MSTSKVGQSGGRLVVDGLLDQGVDTLFCVPGESYLSVLDAIYDAQDRLRLVSCRHESGAAMMAVAQAHLTGRTGVCFVTRGPGATNASIALHIAQQASIPLVLGVGQVRQDALGREAFQELDLESFFKPVTKHVQQITCTKAIPLAVAKAFQIAASDRPGPVVLAFPQDVLDEIVVAGPEIPRLPRQRGLHKSEVEQIKSLLQQAHQPVLIVGGSSLDTSAIEHIERFADQNKIPVCVSFRRLDCFDNTHPSYAGYLGLSAHDDVWSFMNQSDCVLVLGARLDEPSTQGYTLFPNRHNVKLIHVYPNLKEIGLNYGPDVGVCADVNKVARTLADIKLETNPGRERWCRRLNRSYLKASVPPVSDGKIDLGAVMATLDARTPNDAIVTLDAGNFTRWPQRYRAYRRPGRLLAPVNGAMGYGVPAAIAASLLHPKRTVIGFVGDGGMLMTGMELATAAKYGAAPLILVFNNNRYGTIETHQDQRYPGRRIGNDLCNPDFAAFARSFGLFGERVTETAQFERTLTDGLTASTAAVIELVLDDG